MIKLSAFAVASLAAVAFLLPLTSESQLDARQDSKPSASDESRAYLHGFNIPSSGLALEGYCPVAYFAVNKPVRGKPEFASTHDGVTYYLVNANAKKAFDEEPEKYLPAYGGWCAFGMAVEDKFPIDPTKFKIVDGRLFVFLKNKNVNALELWNKGDEKELIEKADAHWAKVSG